MSQESASGRLAAQAEELKELYRDMLMQHSGSARRGGGPPSRHTVYLGPEFKWRPLDDNGRRAQAELRAKYTQFSGLIRALGVSLDGNVSKVGRAHAVLSEAIEQRAGLRTSFLDDHWEHLVLALDTLIGEVAALFDPAPGEHVFVPDANAIVYNPDLEEWEFEGAPRFQIVLTPTLLAELDELKMPHRGVREKAEGAIRRVKEYRRRGDIRSGVPLRRDRSTVRMTAVEPHFESAPAWLDPAVRDDRLLASVLEIVRERPHSAVVLVTRDINLQNKADHAGVPCVEPPEPPEGSASPKPRGQRVDVRIFEINASGGGGDVVTFWADVQNYGQQPVRVTIEAAVGANPVVCFPSALDLLVNHAPVRVTIQVPRPELGDLVPAFNHDTTLYGRELVVEIKVDGEAVRTETWREETYESITNADRFNLQQAIWRIGRGEATDDDLRREAIATMMARHRHR